MSGLHATIYLSDNGRVRIRDEASRNGTRMGNNKIADAELREGSEIHLGTTALEILTLTDLG